MQNAKHRLQSRRATTDNAFVMTLALSLPAVEARPAHPPETRPARVVPWLEETLKRDPIEAAATIGDALAATNRVLLSEARRLELAERYYATSFSLWPQLERHFTRAQHPLTGHALAAAKAALTLSTELATAYKHLLAHESEKRLILSSNRQLIALIHRCLQCTNRILINSYQAYAPVPARTWHDAHAIYVFAHGRNLQMVPVASDSAETTPERYYVQALLLALANPYGFMPGHLGRVIQYLHEYAHWARITDVPPVHRLAKAVAIVPVGHDFPPFAANKGANVNGGKLFLLTFDLAFQIQEQLRALEAGGAPPPSVGIDPAAKTEHIALLRRLLRQWAIPPARQFNRLPSRARVVMCAGLSGVWQYSRGTHPDLPAVSTGLPAMSTCQVINHTPAGYALRQVDTVHAALRIGDLIALRVEGRNALQVAMIRWFRNTLRGSGLEFGCELLSDNPQAAAARAEDVGTSAPVPAIVLPDDGQDNTPSMVIVPAGSFELEQAISLRVGERMDTSVLTKLVEQGPGFELYEYVAVG
jgi:cyclic-di-GMP-binding protein